jgi:hypothetical protein
LKIERENQIDKNKLSQLFISRGHGLQEVPVLQTIYDVLDGKVKHHSVYQCDCGELFYVHDGVAKAIAERLEVDVADLPCKVCGDYKELTVESTFMNALDDLLESVPESGSTSGTGSAGDFLRSLIPGDGGPAEFIVGRNELRAAILSNFPNHGPQFRARIRKLGRDALTANQSGFHTYISSLASQDRLHIGTRTTSKRTEL